MIYLLGFDAKTDGPKLFQISDHLHEHIGGNYPFTVVNKERFEKWLAGEIHQQALERKPKEDRQ